MCIQGLEYDTKQDVGTHTQAPTQFLPKHCNDRNQDSHSQPERGSFNAKCGEHNLVHKEKHQNAGGDGDDDDGDGNNGDDDDGDDHHECGETVKKTCCAAVDNDRPGIDCFYTYEYMEEETPEVGKTKTGK